jgi:putative transposase
MTQIPDCSTSACWARFRFSVVGSLLSAPVRHGELQATLQALADKTWTHPVSGELVQFAAATIERWYYTARRAKDDPVHVLRRAVRKDCGKISLPAAQAERLFAQYRDHDHWTYQLHYDNLVARVQAEPALGPLRSLLHGAAIHAGARLGSQAAGDAQGAARRGTCGAET